MPQLQTLVLTDRTPTTPANLTFSPRGIDAKGVAEVVSNAGIPLGEKRCTVSMNKRNGRFYGQVRLTLPVVQTETISGISRPVVVRTSYANVEFVFDESSTKQERDDTIGLLASALGTGKVLVNDTLVNCEGVY